MSRSPDHTFPPLSDRLPIVTYTNAFRAQPETIWMSPQVEHITGYPAEKWLGRPGLFERILHPEDRRPVLEEVRASREELRPFSRDYRLLDPEGRVVWIHDESVPIMNDDGQPEFIQGYFVDISERKALERELLHAQKAEALGRFAAGIAHDFNNFLAAIAGYAELAQRKVGPQSPARASLASVLATCDRALKLTRQLLTFSRRQELEAQPVDLELLVRDLEAMLLHVAGRTVQLDLELAATPTVLADAGQLEQVVMNLVANARDAGAGRVAIRTSVASIERGEESTRLALAPGRYVVVAVSDTGCGMDDETVARIFDPFFTTKGREHGTGLGLALAQGVIKQSGGTIEVSSVVGAGSTFRILLPVADVG